jgi:hypothetical protein
MPKKTKEIVEEYQSPEEEPTPEPEIKISKRTGKPVRPLTEKQKETLAKGREIAIAKRKELLVGVDLAKRAETIKKAKEELRNARNKKLQDRLDNQKKEYEDAIKEGIEEEEEEKPAVKAEKAEKKEKKIKKKVIKYVEASSSESEEEEVIVRRRKEPRHDNIPENILRQRMRSNLEDIKSNSLAKIMMPSYY